MAEHLTSSPSTKAPALKAELGLRSLLALAIILALAVVYSLFAIAGIAPVPRSINSLASQHVIGHGKALVSGYYLAQPFVSYGGLRLPPYVLATSPRQEAPAIHVSPSLADLHAGPMTAIIDTATGDGTQWAPYVIHTLMQTSAFNSAALVSLIALIMIAFGIAGPLSNRLVRRTR